MKIEKSAGFIIYRIKKDKIFYLLLKYSAAQGEKEYWGFSKGHLEAEEDFQETAIRELYEETGIQKSEISINPSFKRWIKYFFKKDKQTVFKLVVYFLAETKKESIKLSAEHLDYKWASYREAKKLISFSNTKEVLRSVHDTIS